MEEIKEIILSHCKGIAYPEFELEDLNVMVKEINDHYTNVKSQELTKAKEELRMLPRAVIEECMRHLLELSRGSASSSSFHFVISQLNIFKNQIHNSTPPETLSQISAIIKTNKSQAKEIEGLREDKSKLTKLCSLLNYTALGFEKESENYSEILELWPQVMLRTFEMLDTTQPDKGGD